MTAFRRVFLPIAFLLGNLLAGAQTRTAVLSGYVRDAESGEPLPQAVVYLEDRKTGVAADAVGFYSLHVPVGKHTVFCSFFGYETVEMPLEITKALQKDFHLKIDRSELEAATIFSRSKREEIKLPQMGLERVDATLVKKMPALVCRIS